MPLIQNIPLNDVRVIGNAAAAGAGALLQFVPVQDSPAMIGLKAIWPGANPCEGGIVILEGAEAGAFLIDHQLFNVPALDVSGLVEIGIGQIAPRRASRSDVAPGGIYQLPAKGSSPAWLGLAVRLPNTTFPTGFLRLSQPDYGRIEAAAEAILLGTSVVLVRAPAH